jgi:hypothetical protein
MLYNLCLAKNKPYSNTLMAHPPAEVVKEWDQVFSDETMSRYGQKWVVYCDSTWSNEEYSVFAVHTIKDMTSRLTHWKEIEKAKWYQYADLTTLFGTSEEEPHLPTFPNPIYQLFMVRTNPVTMANMSAETKEQTATRWAKWRESADRTGALGVLYCDSYWANEDYLGFGVVAYPNVEARQAHATDLLKLNWTLYYSAFTLLGTPRS